MKFHGTAQLFVAEGLLQCCRRPLAPAGSLWLAIASYPLAAARGSTRRDLLTVFALLPLQPFLYGDTAAEIEQHEGC